MKKSSHDTGPRIAELDGLRGLAILLVILCHYVGNPDHSPLGFLPHRFLLAFTAGWSGVDLFFVLSGFLIGGILLEARDSPNYFRTFYTRRVFRILPIYYLWTMLFAFVVIVGVTFAGRLATSRHELLRIPVQLLFLQNIFIGMPKFPWMWFGVTWSLAIEEQFYLVAPPFIRILSRRQLATALTAAIIMAPVLRFMLFRYWAPGSYVCAFLMPCRADSLSCGILLALCWREESFRDFAVRNALIIQRVLAVLFLGVCGLFWWLVHPINPVTVTVGYTWLALFFSVVLLTVVSNKSGWLAAAMRWRFLGWLGGISYCVYLLHDAFNFFAHQLVFHADPRLYTIKHVVVSIAALLATLGVASFSWRFFEKPLIRIGHRYSYDDARKSRHGDVLSASARR